MSSVANIIVLYSIIVKIKKKMIPIILVIFDNFAMNARKRKYQNENENDK